MNGEERAMDPIDWAECHECEAVIKGKEPYWSVNVHKERFEQGAVEVMQATAVAVFCDSCASKRDLYQIHVPFKRGHNGSPEGTLGG